MISRTEQAGRTGAAGGFTLIEVLVVLVILGLVAGLVLARGPQRSAGVDLRAQASQIAQALRGARGMAIASNRRVVFALDPVRRSFRVGGGAERLIPAQMQVSVVTTEPPGTIAFAPDGSASGGRVELAEGQLRMRVGVDWLTGRVSVDAP